MRSAAPRAATTRSIPLSARSTISVACVRPPRRTASKLRSISPCSVRLTTPGCASTRTGSSGGRTARSATPKTRRKNTRTSSTSIFTPDAAVPALWLALRDVVLFWAGSGRAPVPRRQSAHQAAAVLGMADRRSARALSRRDLPRRGVHPAEADVPAGQARLFAVLHLFHLAQYQGGADRIPDRADDHCT